MKKIVAFILAVVLGLAVTGSVEARAAKPSKKAEVKEIVIKSSLHCEKCVKKVEENISFEKGVKALKVDLDSNTITVSFDAAKTSGETLVNAVRKLGYSAEIMK